MTAMRDRVSFEEDTETSYELDLPVQLDEDDYFEPTIVRGRE